MKQILSVSILATGIFLASCGETKTETPAPAAPASPLAGDVRLAVDPAASQAKWKGELLGIYAHEGLVTVKEGNVQMKDGKVTGGTFVVDLKTITTSDANYDPKSGKSPEALVGHLSSPDFFAVDSFPTATFTISQISGDNATGLLTVRGRTHEEKVSGITVTPEGDGARLTGNLTFDRQKYGVAYTTGAKDKVLSDDITIQVALVAKKAS